MIARVITDIIAIDPGLVSGCAHITVGPNGLGIVSTAELSPIETGEWLEKSLRLVPDLETTAIVAERFTITVQTAKNSQAPWSLEVIGQTRWIMSRIIPGRELLLQTPADAKAVFPNARLKALGLWHVGDAGHALDALRHAALVVHRAKLLPRQD